MTYEAIHVFARPIVRDSPAEIRRFEPILNKSKLAQRAGMNKHTLASKLWRKSRFTHEETGKLRDAIYG